MPYLLDFYHQKREKKRVEGQGERSERVVSLQGVAHELTEIALALPHGWGVLIESNGQVRIVPPGTGRTQSTLRFPRSR
jgi:hypothetical protein